MSHRKIFISFIVIFFVVALFFIYHHADVSADPDASKSEPTALTKTSDVKSFWTPEETSTETKIPDAIVSMSSGYIIVVDKKSQKIYVFTKNGNYAKVFEAPCSTGKNSGDKQLKGDAKTPNGIFFVTKILNNPGPPETYGSMAFHLNYPTLSDKRAGKEGNNIWIHGTTKPLMPQQSNGCVVLRDQDLKQLANYIFVNRTPVIISEAIRWVPQDAVSPFREDFQKILSAWNKAFTEKDFRKLDALYLEEARIKGSRRDDLLNKLKCANAISKHFVLAPKDVMILKEGHHAVIVFDQIYVVNPDNSFQGFYNKLILEKVNNNWRLVDESSLSETAERRLASTKGTQREIPEDTLVKKEIRSLVQKWLVSWESGNFDNYRNCYTVDFKSKEMNLDAWIMHKKTVRQNSRNIRIRITGLYISPHGETATASFTQHYSSSTLRSATKKILELKKTNGQWKIYREII